VSVTESARVTNLAIRAAATILLQAWILCWWGLWWDAQSDWSIRSARYRIISILLSMAARSPCAVVLNVIHTFSGRKFLESWGLWLPLGALSDDPCPCLQGESTKLILRWIRGCAILAHECSDGTMELHSPRLMRNRRLTQHWGAYHGQLP
jgi:hypothetical protein